ncbi:MAG: IS110 family transposase [Chloroflexi bacterium]|jgi:transposase|nr:IS110 family transposase [Chloroflexota bacterium]
MDILGVDVSKSKFDVALLRDNEYVLATFHNDSVGFVRLRKWLKKRKVNELHACLEATGRYGDDLALYLHEAGYRVSIANPARIHAYAVSQLKRNKTDREDAKLIAHFCATQDPELWTPPAQAQQELQAMVRHLESLQTMRQQESNRLQAGVPSMAVRETLEAHIAFLDEQINQLTQRIRDHIDHHPDLKQQKDLLTSIPGIADVTATKLLAEIPSLERFQGASQLAAYAGLTPRQHQSGSSVFRRGRMAKTGNAHLRRALYMPALVALRWNPIIRVFADRLRERGKHKMVIIGAVMRKLLHIVYGVLNSGMPFDPSYAVNFQDSA